MVWFLHMTAQALAYPFLFISIFFEAFILVTILSKPAREARARTAVSDDAALPTAAVIVPCLNEGETVAKTADSLLALDYPKKKLEIILVDNGSTDDTPQIMERYRAHPQIKILRVEERGKHHAVNAGIAATNAELVGCLDADSFVEPNSLRELVRCFENPKVAAATAGMSVNQPDNLLRHMQNAEYIFGIAVKHALAAVNGIFVTPGPFSFYRRAVITELGGFKHGHQTEDLEMALRLQKAGHWIDNAPRARVYTKAPRTLLALIKQRTRWTSGFMRNVFHEYRFMIGNKKHGALGMIVIPVGLIAITSGILLFGLSLFELGRSAYNFYRVHTGVPLSYALLPHSYRLDWFYIPTSFYIILGATVIAATLSMIIFGRRLSKTPANLALGLVSYLFIYGLVVPFWLIRATSDVALGKRRSWR